MLAILRFADRLVGTIIDQLAKPAAIRIDWPAVGRWSMRQARRLALIAAVVAVIVGILYGARWSCEMNPACPWDHFYLKRSQPVGIGDARLIV